MAISLDLSQKNELRLLAALLREVARAANGAPFFLAGAYARDVLLFHAHGIDTGRQTADVDVAIALESWERYEALRAALIARDFEPIAAAHHKLKFRQSIEVDFVPFGGVERPDRTIAWPPDGSFVMRSFGFREVQRHTITVGLPDATDVEVATLPALTLLKLVAWSERRLTEPGKDAHDLSLICAITWKPVTQTGCTRKPRSCSPPKTSITRRRAPGCSARTSPDVWTPKGVSTLRRCWPTRRTTEAP